MQVVHHLPMLFPGQASQFVGMTADLADGDGPAAAFLSGVDSILSEPLTNIMHRGPAETLTETNHAQPAILAHSVAICLALKDLGIEPTIVAGHSLGEYSAAVAAGALAAADGLKLVQRRGELMRAAGLDVPGTMAAVMGLTAEAVRDVCAGVAADGETVVLANHNSENQLVISGTLAGVAAASDALREAGARRVIGLNVSGAFHSPLLAGAARSFGEGLAKVPLDSPRVPLVANVTGKTVNAPEALMDGFARQLTAPVLWHDTMRLMAGGEQKPRVILEVGPGRVLSNLARRAYPDTTFIPVGTAEDLAGIQDRLSELLGDAHE